MHNDNIDKELDATIMKATEITKNKWIEPLYVELPNNREYPLNKSISNSSKLIDVINFIFTNITLIKQGYRLQKIY